MCFFVSYGGVGSVSGVDDGVVGQGEDFLADHLEQQFVVAGGEVAAADAALEEHIAADEEFVGGVVEADAAVAVAGRVEHAEALVAEADLVTLFQEPGRCGHVIHRYAKCDGVCVSLVIDTHTTFMAPYRHVEMRSAPAVAGNMVDVRMRVDDALHGQMVRFHVFFQLLVFVTLAVARVDDDCLARFVVQDQCVDLYGVEMKGAYRHSLKPSRQILYVFR